MSYFDARIDKRLDTTKEKHEREPEIKDRGPLPYFAAKTGPQSPIPSHLHWSPQVQVTQYPISGPQSPLCPLCRGSLLKKDGLYHCQGRCGARWLEESTGRLVDLAALPFGVCACCEQPRALVKGERGAVCPTSGRAYLLLPDGGTFPADAAPHGICQCCIPPLPLVWRDGNLICQAKPEHRYRRAGDRVTLAPAPQPTLTPAEALEAIDVALRRNDARVTVNGLFDVK